MATNQDFDDLIVRIEAATDTLEADVGTLSDAVPSAQAAVTTATEQAGIATDAATSASEDALVASNAASTATGLVTDLENAVVIEEAPKDSKTYGRNDGEWVEVTGGGGGGSVESVNGVEPGVTGDVTLTASDVNALPDTYIPSYNNLTEKPSFSAVATSGDYNGLTNKPTIPDSTSDLTNDSGFLTDAPSDGTQYAREDGAWVEVESGGGSAGGYAFTETGVHYDSVVITAWPFTNPNKAMEIEKVGKYVKGRFKSSYTLFKDAGAGFLSLPEGMYTITGTWPNDSTPFSHTRSLVIQIMTRGSGKTAIAHNPRASSPHSYMISTSSRGGWLQC